MNSKFSEEAIYAACLKAAHELGSRIFGMSWFVKNQRKAVKSVVTEPSADPVASKAA